MTDPTQSKKIMLRFTRDEYAAIRAAAFGRGLEMGLMLVDVLRPVVSLLMSPNEAEQSDQVTAR